MRRSGKVSPERCEPWSCMQRRQREPIAWPLQCKRLCLPIAERLLPESGSGLWSHLAAQVARRCENLEASSTRSPPGDDVQEGLLHVHRERLGLRRGVAPPGLEAKASHLLQVAEEGDEQLQEPRGLENSSQVVNAGPQTATRMCIQNGLSTSQRRVQPRCSGIGFSAA